MSSEGNVLRLRENLADKFGERELRPQRFQATMGDGTGAVVVPGKPNYVYVRRLGRGRIEECLNNKAAARDGLPVIAGYSHESPEILQILEVDWPSFTAPGNYSYVQHHHEAHELGNTAGGDDVVWVQSQQLMPLLVYPTNPASMFVNVFGGWYPWVSGWHYFDPVLSADFTPHLPTLPAEARFVLISIDGATEALQYTVGTPFPTFMPPVDAENLIPAAPVGSIPIAAVYLPFGTTTLGWANLYDMRLFNQPVGGSVTPAAHALLDSIVHSDTVTNAPLQGSLVIGNATPAWDDLVHPGAAGYALVSGGATFAWSLTPTWLGTHTWGSGFNVLPTDATGQALGAAGTRWDLHTQDIYFEGATGANIITITDNLADALHVVDTGAGDIFLQIVTTTGSEEVIFNAGGDDVDFTVQAVGVADALLVQGSDGQITLGALTAGFAKSSAAGVLSVALEVALAELAGYVQGSIIRGGAVDWEAYALAAGAGYALISTATDIVWDQTPAWTGRHSFAAGITFNGGAGINSVVIPDALADAFDITDGVEFLRLNTANDYFLIDPAAAGVMVAIGAAVPGYHLDVQLNLAAGGFRIQNDGGHSINYIRSKAASEAGVVFQDAAVSKWAVYKTAGNAFNIYSYATTHTPFEIQVDDDVILCKDGGSVAIGTTTTVGDLRVYNATTANMYLDGFTDNAVLYIRSGLDAGGGEEGVIIFTDGAAGKWQVGKGAGNTFFIYSYATTHNPFEIQVDDDVILCNSGGNVGINTAAPQGLLHGYNSIGGFLYWEWNNLDGTWRTIIPNGVGDVTVRAEWLFVISSAAGSAGSHLTLANGALVTWVAGGADTVRWEVQADGTFRVQRSAGANPIDVAMWIIWL